MAINDPYSRKPALGVAGTLAQNQANPNAATPAQPATPAANPNYDDAYARRATQLNNMNTQMGNANQAAPNVNPNQQLRQIPPGLMTQMNGNQMPGQGNPNYWNPGGAVAPQVNRPQQMQPWQTPAPGYTSPFAGGYRQYLNRGV